MTKSHSLVAGLLLAAAAGLTCRWESCTHTDRGGAVTFQYRGLLLPWQDAPAPPPGPAVASVSVQKWSHLGFNRFDHTGPPAAVATPTAGSTTQASAAKPR